MLAGDGETNVNFLWTVRGGIGPNTLPAAVIGLCRKIVDQLIFGGDPHGVRFELTYAECTYSCYVRQDQVGGYKVMIQTDCGCADKRSFLLLVDTTPEPNVYYGSRPTGLVELIDPTDGLPRPDPDPATFTKSYHVPNEIRFPTVGVDPARAPGGYVRTSSMFSGQMRMIVGCYHLNGKDAPFGYTWGKTHGVVEYPTIRTVDGNGKYPPGEKFWIVEISPAGVFAMPINYRQKCCDLEAQVLKAMPTLAEIAATPALQEFRTELSLEFAFANKPAANVTQLISAANMAAVYAKGNPQALAHGWAFSYSGNEASNVVFTAHNSPDNYWEIWHPKIAFTVTEPTPNTYTISAAESYLTSNAQMHNNTTTLVWFPSEAYPGKYEQLFPFSFNGGTTLASGNYANIPIYVFYRGDVRHTLTMSSIDYPAGGFSTWSNPTMQACSGIWTQNSSTQRVRYRNATREASIAFAGDIASCIQGNKLIERISNTPGTFYSFICEVGQTTGFCGCRPEFSNISVWWEYWTTTKEVYSEDIVHTGVVAAVISQSDRESLFLLERNGQVGSNSIVTTPQYYNKITWQCCRDTPYTQPPGTLSPTLPPSVCVEILSDRSADACNGLGSNGTPVNSGGSINTSIDTPTAHVGSNDFTLASNADFPKFFVAKNPSILEPTYSPGPISYHGNLGYNEPNMVAEGVTNPLIHYVLSDGTNPVSTNGGFSLIKPPSGPAIAPRAFVGRV